MKKTLRTYLSQFWFIHAMAALGLFALWGYLATNNKYILLGVVLSWAGALCGSFIRVIDTVAKDRKSHSLEDPTWFN